jgi:uncharacterized membrane protein
MTHNENEIMSKVAEINLKIEELRNRRKALLSELGEGRLSWSAIITGGFGALMIGLGVIALFAANWDAFGREARAVIALAPVVACGVAAILAHARGVKSRALWEPVGILWCVSVAAAACLVAQTYQVGGSVPGLVLLVALLMLPVIWVTRAAAPMALWPIMAIVWTISSIGIGGGGRSIALAVKGVALMALSLPAYIVFLRSNPRKAALVTVQVVTGLVYSFGLGLLVSAALPLRYDGTSYVYVFWLCAALVVGAGKMFALPVWGMAGTIVAAAAAFPTPVLHNGCAYFIALALVGGIIAYGVSKLRIGFANIGAVTFLWLILAKFFESRVSFTVKGVVLIASGLALTALNVALVRIRKARRA